MSIETKVRIVKLFQDSPIPRISKKKLTEKKRLSSLDYKFDSDPSFIPPLVLAFPTETIVQDPYNIPQLGIREQTGVRGQTGSGTGGKFTPIPEELVPGALFLLPQYQNLDNEKSVRFLAGLGIILFGMSSIPRITGSKMNSQDREFWKLLEQHWKTFNVIIVQVSSPASNRENFRYFRSELANVFASPQIIQIFSAHAIELGVSLNVIKPAGMNILERKIRQLEGSTNTPFDTSGRSLETIRDVGPVGSEIQLGKDEKTRIRKMNDLIGRVLGENTPLQLPNDVDKKLIDIVNEIDNFVVSKTGDPERIEKIIQQLMVLRKINRDDKDAFYEKVRAFQRKQIKRSKKSKRKLKRK